jgi:hypothetical protein
VARAADRVTTDQAGEFAYTDKADATVKMTFTGAEPKDSAIVINLTSKVTWLTTPPKRDLTGDLTLVPTLSGTDKITVKYGALEAADFFTVANTAFQVTRSGRTAEMPFFGFSKVETAGNATNAVTYAIEGDKSYEVNTLTQTFKFTHSDGTTKDVDIVVMEARKDMTGVERQLVDYEEISKGEYEEFGGGQWHSRQVKAQLFGFQPLFKYYFFT